MLILTTVFDVGTLIFLIVWIENLRPAAGWFVPGHAARKRTGQDSNPVSMAPESAVFLNILPKDCPFTDCPFYF